MNHSLRTAVPTLLVLFGLCSPGSAATIVVTGNYINTLHLPASSSISLGIALEKNSESAYGFIVFQAHSYKSSLTLSQSESFPEGLSLNGTDIGITLLFTSSGTSVQQVYLRNLQSQNVSVLIKTTQYDKHSPIPGGCNLEFVFKNDPNTFLSDRSAGVDRLRYQYSQLELLTDTPCDLTLYPDLLYTSYILYLTGGQAEYYDKLSSFMTVEDIKKYGTEINSTHRGDTKSETAFTALSATDYLTVMVVSRVDNSSVAAAYVSSAKINANLKLGIDDIVIMAVVGLIGLFMCFTGHRFYLIDTFLFGFLTFTFISTVCLETVTHFSLSETAAVGAVGGLLGGCVYMLLWYKVCSPYLSTALKGFTLGMVLTCCILITPLYNVLLVSNYDYLYWVLFCCAPIILASPLIFFTKKLSLTASAVVGSSCVMAVTVSYLCGASLYIIFLHVIHKARYHATKDSSLDRVFLVFPFQVKEILISVFWAVLAILGILSQAMLVRNRPPFEKPPKLCTSCKERNLTLTQPPPRTNPDPSRERLIDKEPKYYGT